MATKLTDDLEENPDVYDSIENIVGSGPKRGVYARYRLSPLNLEIISNDLDTGMSKRALAEELAKEKFRIDTGGVKMHNVDDAREVMKEVTGDANKAPSGRLNPSVYCEAHNRDKGDFECIVIDDGLSSGMYGRLKPR